MSKNKNYTAEDVISLCREYMNEKSIQFIEKAIEYATFAHKDQVRKSGEAYIVHPIQVAGILAELRLDPDTIATGFLHDVVEDTGFTIDDIEYVFGKDVAFLVDVVTDNKNRSASTVRMNFSRNEDFISGTKTGYGPSFN